MSLSGAAGVDEWSALVAALAAVLAALAAVLRPVIRAWRFERLLRHLERGRACRSAPTASDRDRADDLPDDLA